MAMLCAMVASHVVNRSATGVVDRRLPPRTLEGLLGGVLGELRIAGDSDGDAEDLVLNRRTNVTASSASPVAGPDSRAASGRRPTGNQNFLIPYIRCESANGLPASTAGTSVPPAEQVGAARGRIRQCGRVSMPFLEVGLVR